MTPKMPLLRLSMWAIPCAMVLAQPVPVATSQSVHSQGGCVAPPAGLISWWPGDGNAQDIADGNNGTVGGGNSFGAGMVDQAFSLDGFDDFVAVGNPVNLHLSTSDFTVDAWVNFDSLVKPPGSPSGPCFGPGCDMSIVEKMVQSPLNSDGWRLLKQSDNHFWFCLGSNLGCDYTAPTGLRSTTVPTAGLWYHVAAVKSSGGMSLFVNGVLEDSKPLPSFVDSDSADLRLGYYQPSVMYGRIDEVEIFNRALSGGEIQAIYAAGSAGKCKSPSVGGMAEPPQLEPEAATRTRANHSLAPGAFAIAGLAAGVLVLAIGGWYARRRWLR